MNNVANEFNPDSVLYKIFAVTYSNFTGEEFIANKILSDKQEFQGVINGILMLVFLLTRLFIMAKNTVRYLFKDRVRIKRNYNIMGVEFEFVDMVKYLYNKYPLYLGIVSSLMFIAVFTMLID